MHVLFSETKGKLRGEGIEEMKNERGRQGGGDNEGKRGMELRIGMKGKIKRREIEEEIKKS